MRRIIAVKKYSANFKIELLLNLQNVIYNPNLKLEKFDSFTVNQGNGLLDTDQEVINYIQRAINILRENLPQQILLFDEVCQPDCPNNDLPTGMQVQKV